MKNSYTIKGLHTVGQYKIMQEINKNFEEESVDVYFVSDEEAVVKDKNGNQMKVLYRDKIVIRQIKRCRFHQIKTGLSEHLTMG